jgi:hypothetical protein
MRKHRLLGRKTLLIQWQIELVQPFDRELKACEFGTQ